MTAPLEILSSFREWAPYALAVGFVGGLLFGCLVRSLKLRLCVGFGAIVLPPAAAAALYWWGSSAACDGVDCSNIVLSFVYVIGFAIFPMCMGIGTLLGSIIGGIRRSIDRWVTPPSANASVAE